MLAERIGADGYELLQAILAGTVPEEVRTWPRVEIMRQIWLQHYYVDDKGVHWRTRKTGGNPRQAVMISSPHDLDANFRVKRSTSWIGYQVHLTETCESDAPRVITQVETTPATTHDVHLTEPIQTDLIKRNLKPDTHLVDGGYVEADLLVESQERNIDLVGPAPGHQQWQDKVEGGLDHSKFQFDWEQKHAICPGGKTSIHWNERRTRRQSTNVAIAFDRRQFVGLTSPSLAGAKIEAMTPHVLEKQYEALQQARKRQTTPEYKKLYGLRAGIEGTISTGVRVMGMRRSRYRGLARTHVPASPLLQRSIFTGLSIGSMGKGPSPPLFLLSSRSLHQPDFANRINCFL